LAKHDSILREAIETNNGHYVKTTGDGVHAVFEKAVDTVNAMILAQHNFLEPLEGVEIKVRMGAHSGEAELREGDYYGQPLNRTARLMSVGHGGQILLSAVTTELVRNQLPANTVLTDLGQHRLKDLIKPEHIFQVTTEGLPVEFSALKSLSSLPNNLPLQLTTFIGRENEMAEAKKRLTSARLLTLIGPGGTGKTRLSLQLGADLLSKFSDGVWFVELAPLADPALIMQALASALGVREQMGMPLDQIVINYLRAKNLLIVLDNCEHLVDACAQLAEQFLQTCPQIKIIASSREALGVNGETIYRVPSLTVPDPSRVTLAMLAHCEAVQLFVERAKASSPKFELTEKNASSVAQICRRLDGIPLAIELAAARVTVLSAEQIASRLDDRFKLLTGGSRTALPRQQTLRALIDWSYDMLSEEERSLMRHLSVFAGGWSYDAAEHICPGHDALDLLAQLVNKSIVAVDDEKGEKRYRLLETIRQYARDKLLDMGESETARNIHAEYFFDIAETAEPLLFTSESLYWMEYLEMEHDNFRAALEWFLESNVEAALVIATNLSFFWSARGYHTEGRVWAETALGRVEALPPVEGEAALNRKKLIAYAMGGVITMAIAQGNNASAGILSKKCTDLARELNDNFLLARTLALVCSGHLVTGNTDGVEPMINEALDAARKSGDKFALGMALGLTAELLTFLDKDHETMEKYSNESITLLKNSGNQWGMSIILLGMGMAAKYMGRYDEVRTRFAILEPLFIEIGDKHRLNIIYSEFAHIERFEGHHDKANQMYRETIVEWQRLGHRAAVANQLECLAFIAKVREQPEHAAKLFGAAEILREKINIQMSQFEQVEYDQQVKELRAGMNESEFASAWAEGRSMTMEQAIQLTSS
ncbi:MAG: adenylate/guanylate cyclase domain-containing protein, partial [Gemmatimonadota bacterium]|nr:adenylate/guanylate cyclase domain-containing protein [Gemmatimonadota bacterium]